MARDYYDDSFEYEEFDECEDYEYEEFDESEDYECEDYEDNGYEWTAEDSWDALTDGMYGDMPRNPMEYDAMMDAMGF